VTISRNLNLIMTGNLEGDLNCYPLFPGKEKHYLKAVLVRITHGTNIVPKGLYKTNEDNPNETEYDEEFKMPDITELGTPETWNF